MKYTRYDMKRKKNGNLSFIIVMLSTVIFAFIIGTAVFNLLFKNTAMNEPSPKPSSGAVQVSKTNEKAVVKYIAVQHGLFQKQEYLEPGKNKLVPYGNPFTINEDQKGTRIFLGIYNEDEGLKAIKTLTDKGIDNSKMIFEINTASNPCDEEISAVIDAELTILTKLSDNNVKSIPTEELKKWCSTEVKEADQNSKNINILKELKQHVNSLPKEITRDKVSECYVYIYNILKKINNK
ncbi:Occlusion-derived virus envelope protein E25 [Clostridiales bacterium oral taxon 876 str. F0540]|nr:Occlusion-derived virus envelope protein E25 [Clostridiales bacterium oral taxon 876 str. F0540]